MDSFRNSFKFVLLKVMKYFLAIFSNLWKLYVIVVFTLVGILLFPIIRCILIKESWHKHAHHFFVIWSWSIRILCFYHVKKIKNSKLPEGPYIVIANHASYLDIFLMPSLLSHHPVLFLGKSELLRYPFLGTYFKKLHIPVFRNDKVKAAKSFLLARNAVRKGWSLIIFPEGGIPDENLPQMIPFKDGAFKLAKNLKVPIVPITFTNNYKLLSDPEHFLRSAYPGISRVYIHDYVKPELVEQLDEKELIQYCFEIIQEPLLREKRI